MHLIIFFLRIIQNQWKIYIRKFQRMRKNLLSACLLMITFLTEYVQNQACGISYCIDCYFYPYCRICNSSVPATYYNYRCYLCTIPNCDVCYNTNVCYSCDTGYYLASNQCNTRCGDGIMIGSQACDDGNTNSHDGCSSTCQVQNCSQSCGCDGWMLPWLGTTCTPRCGDNILRGTETCDDGNKVSHDGCSSTCQTEICSVGCNCDGWIAPWTGTACTTRCGDSLTRGTETCDDGNVISHDGCSSTCRSESCNVGCNCDGWVAPWLGTICSTRCGDSLVRGTQTCDDGNTVSHDGCSSACQTEACNVGCRCDGWIAPWTGIACSTTCGDSLIRGTETCDDGNTFDHDGCSSICRIQSCDIACLCDGWVLPWNGSACATLCGDRLIRGQETCDDGNTGNHDGCSSTCQIQTCNQSCQCYGWVSPWISANNSCSTLCGDSYVRGIQQCDDGNQLSHDGCSSTCTIQVCQQSCKCDGWVLPYLDFNNTCSTVCGDSFIRGQQQCDDANNVSHDGCSSTCQTQICSVSCNCNGWVPPFINGSCSTLCGDGILQGNQQCDTNEYGCDSNCMFIAAPFIQQSSTTYLMLGFFLLGFKIQGIQMLNVFQSFQIIGQTYNTKQMLLAYQIHGYLNLNLFPFEVSTSSSLFKHFNFMVLVIFSLFCLFIIISVVFWLKNRSKNNKVSNTANSEILKTQTAQMQKDIQSVVYSQDDNAIIKKLDPKPQNIQNTIQIKPNTLQKIAAFISRQLFFDLLINCLSVVVFSVAEQIHLTNVDSFLNPLQIGVIVCMLLFILGFLYIYSKENPISGENQLAFHNKKAINFWIIIILQKIIFSALLGANLDISLYVMAGIKLVIIFYFFYSQIFVSKNHKIRSLMVQILHLLLISLIAFNQKYFKKSIWTKSLPTYIIDIVYLLILTLVCLVTFVFYLKYIIDFVCCIQNDKQIQYDQNKMDSFMAKQQNQKDKSILNQDQLQNTQKSLLNQKSQFQCKSNRIFDYQNLSVKNKNQKPQFVDKNIYDIENVRDYFTNKSARSVQNKKQDMKLNLEDSQYIQNSSINSQQKPRQKQNQIKHLKKIGIKKDVTYPEQSKQSQDNNYLSPSTNKKNLATSNVIQKIRLKQNRNINKSSKSTRNKIFKEKQNYNKSQCDDESQSK